MEVFPRRHAQGRPVSCNVGRRGALGILGALAGSLALGRGPAAAQSQGVLRIGGSPQETFAEAYYAEAAGFFKQANLKTEMISLPNSGAMGAAVAGGSIDVALGNPISIANARAQGLQFYIFAPAAIYDTAEPAALLTVANTSPFASAKDLEGKTIATIELRGIMQASIRSWMTAHQADPASVRFIELPFSTMATALAAGRVDAAMIAEPSLTLARPSVRVIGDPYSAVAKQWMSTAWYTTQDRLAKTPDEIRTFANIMTRTAAWAKSHRSESGVVIANLMSLPSEVVAKMSRVRFAEHLDPKLIQPVLDTAFTYGILKSPVGARDLFAPGFS